MAGGPIIDSAFGPAGTNNIVIPTVLQMAVDTLKWFTGMTYLYDWYWEPEAKKSTLTICMYQIRIIKD